LKKFWRVLKPWSKKMVDIDAVYAIVLGLLCFWVYYMTMYRTIAGGDSGDFVACSCNVGVAHPPGFDDSCIRGNVGNNSFAGYPLFTMLGAIFVRIIPTGKV
jgi:hypothetical protein